MSRELLLQALLTLVGSAVVGSLVTGYLNRKKTGAEAEATQATAKKTNNEAYLLLVKPLEDQLADVRTRLSELERKERQQDVLLGQHATWDRLAMRKFAEHGIVIDVPPPLYPEAV
jgi:hypothetical protein